jgi:predicted DCC family thiol-disulfide oxidoreductase YuxK
MTTAVFDGRCVLCQQTRRMVRLLDWFRRVEFLDLHDHQTVHDRYPWLDHEQAMGEIHVIDDRDEVHTGYYGVRRMLRDLPLGVPVWGLLHLPGMDRIGRRAYGWVARHRYQINRLVGVDLTSCDDGSCKLPQG